MKLQDVKATLRAGRYAWPGCYPMYFVTVDGCALCFKCARAEWRLIVGAHLLRAYRSGWSIVGVDVNWEDPDLYCDHCGGRVESAYAEDDAIEESRA